VKTATNPHYVAYARAHGRDADAQLASDQARDDGRGASMLGFILWMSQQKTAFRTAHPEAWLDRYTIVDHAAWAAFLQAVSLSPSLPCPCHEVLS